MAKRMRSDPEADKTAAAIKRKAADAKFAKTQKKSAAAPLLDPKVLQALPPDDVYIVQMAKALRAKKTYETAKSAAKSTVSDAKAKYDETKTGCVAALVGRSVSKTSFERMIILETRRAAKGEDEVTAEIKGEYWMLKAGGFEAGEQLHLPGLEFTNQKNAAALLIRAKKQGLEAGVAAVSISSNPFANPGSPEGQEWLKGWHEGQAANAAKIGKVTSLADVKAKRAVKAGALPTPPVVTAGDAPVKRGRGRPRKVVALADPADPAMKLAAE